MTGFTTDIWLRVLDEKSKHPNQDLAQLARMLHQAVEHAREGRCDKIIEMLDVEAADAMARVNP